ncbi:MaoC/PaaZ C-terminal domain-containing protein [Demetria terragena]|uniref:MaoC/PaaZ C-terminal domain-containing protein n=1 Tax=Demetria terragena TaxID=63959 RepID=UPI00039C3BE6|nr:MaoC/PaaZ C-terminal domain-containing protein [Demetria terragena]
MARTKELKGAPRLAPMMVRAVATAAGRGGAVPELEVVRRGVSVDPDALAAYDQVCGFTLRDSLPATYIHVLTFPLQVALFADRAYPYPLAGSVHLANRITQYRPVRVGEDMRLSVQAEPARTHKRGATVDFVGAAYVGEELVWSGRSTYLHRGQKVDNADPADPADNAGRVGESDNAGRVGESDNDNAGRVGESDNDNAGRVGESDNDNAGRVGEPPRASRIETIETTDPIDGPGARWRLPSDLGRRYARVSGDVNPIHMSRLSAKALGFPRTIAHGMWSAARMLATVENRVPDAYDFDISFRKPVLLPSTVRCISHPSGLAGWDLTLRGDRQALIHAVASVNGRT